MTAWKREKFMGRFFGFRDVLHREWHSAGGWPRELRVSVELNPKECWVGARYEVTTGWSGATERLYIQPLPFLCLYVLYRRKPRHEKRNEA